MGDPRCVPARTHPKESARWGYAAHTLPQPSCAVSRHALANSLGGEHRGRLSLRESTWNVRLADGTEVHLAGQLEDLGLALPRAAWPAVGQVKVVAVPKEGWRRFFESVPLERETG